MKERLRGNNANSAWRLGESFLERCPQKDQRETRFKEKDTLQGRK